MTGMRQRKHQLPRAALKRLRKNIAALARGLRRALAFMREERAFARSFDEDFRCMQDLKFAEMAREARKAEPASLRKFGEKREVRKPWPACGR